VVEDLEYHLALVRAGYRVAFVDATAVYGEMPAAGKGAAIQRSRWEGGRFYILRQRAPGLLADVLSGRLTSLEPLLDLLLLPLAFHVSLLLICVAIPVTVVRIAGLTGLAVVGLHLVAAIQVGRGGWRDYAALLAAPFYVGWKLLLVPALIANSRAGAKWVRTERAAEKRPSS
jgi:cellulose synthase/poly-beta-1,6-N-acetylglucosamine synthase-like glycosyltransferase